MSFMLGASSSARLVGFEERDGLVVVQLDVDGDVVEECIGVDEARALIVDFGASILRAGRRWERPRLVIVEDVVDEDHGRESLLPWHPNHTVFCRCGERFEHDDRSQAVRALELHIARAASGEDEREGSVAARPDTDSFDGGGPSLSTSRLRRRKGIT